MRTYLILAFTCFIVLQSPTQADDVVNKLVKIISGVESIISTTFFTNCQDLKKFFGITPEQFVANNRTPNLTKVEVGLQIQNVTHWFNFSTAATDILASPLFNKSQPISFYLHGFLSNPSSLNVVDMVKSLVNRGGTNVIFIDASALIYFFYMYATTCVEFIGLELGNQLATFVQGGISPSNIHLLGFSLGAHIAGFAGQKFTNLTGQKIGRISAFDAAGPCYFNSHKDLRLSPDDATFVDAIHTDSNVMGISIPIGHVDFYPNGGSAQPQCLLLFQSHLRSWQYFNETLLRGNEQNFLAVKCPSWSAFRLRKCLNNPTTYMGIAVPLTESGIFYLRTADTSSYPFGLKAEGIKPVYDPLFEFYAWFMSLFGITV